MDILTAIGTIRGGDTSAFSVLYDASYERVYRFVYHRTLDTAMTEDIVSEVFFKAMRKVHTLRATSDGEFFSWILRVAYTTMIDTIRGSGDTDSLDEMIVEPAAQSDVSADIDNKDKLQEVVTFMETLSERDRQILTMRIWDELSYEEISEITGQSIANVKQIVSRSLAKISANVEYLIILFLVIPSVFR